MARPATAAVRLLTGEREPCRLATTGPIDVDAGGLLVIDGVQTEVGDRILVKDQTDGSENGIRTASEGQWYRAADARTARTMQKGTTVHVAEGATNGGKTFVFNTLNPVIGDTDIEIVFYQSDDQIGIINAAIADGLSSVSAATLAALASISAALATIALPNPAVANSFLQRNAGNTAYDAKTSTEVRNALAAAVFVADRAAVKALDPTKDRAATTYGEGVGRNDTWLSYPTSSLSAADQAAAATDSSEAVYLTSGSYTWVRQFTAAGALALEYWAGAADGTTTNTAAFNSAVALLPASGGAISFRGGDYLFATAPSAVTKPLTLRGIGRNKTTLSVSFAAGDFLAATSGYQDYRDLRIRSTVTKTSGAFIKIDTIRASIQNLYLEAPYLGIWLTKNSTLSRVSHVEMRNITPSSTSFGSTGLQVGETGGVAAPDSVQIDHVTVANDTSNHHYAGLRIKSGTATTVESCQFLQGLFSALIDVGNGDSVLSTKFPNCYLDSASQAALYCTATGTGNITRILANGTWFSTASQGSGVVLASMGTGVANGVEFDGCEFVLNLNDGISVADAKWTNVRVNGGIIAGNNIGIELSANVGTFSVRNATIGQSDGFSGNTTGITLQAGTGNNIEIQNNTMRGNTNAISNSATGTANRIEGNIGYNNVPVGASITVGASPFTYTAGPRPETVYIIAGTVSGVVQAGVTIANTTNVAVQLAPNESFQTTFSSVPFMNKIQH